VGEPTVPTTIGVERATNPFLRASDVATFATLRSQKDTY
jgi:hydroxyacylglutathione hydrolase